MGDWQDFPLPDGSYSDATRPWTQQDVVNYLPTFAEQTGTRSRLKHVQVPGLKPFAVVGNGPHRGARDVEGKAFVVSGSTLYRVTPAGVAVSCGTIPGTSRVSMVHNQIDGGNELVIATGSNSYVYNTVSDTLTATGVPLLFVDFINQTIVGVDVGRRFWRYSGLADATSWNALDVESAESSPDRLVGLIVSQGEVLLFGERTIEVWSNSPTESTAFQRSTVIEKGCANGNTVCRLDNTVYFCGNDGIPYRLQGYTPVPIASKAITQAVSEGDPNKLFAFTWEDKGYVVYYLSAQDGRTWGFDVTCQKWHRRESFGLDRWRLNTLFKSNGEWYGGDYSSGNVYRLAWGYSFEGVEAPLVRRLRWGVLHNNGNRVFVHGFNLALATGAPESVPAKFALAPYADPPCGVQGDAYSYAFSIAGGTAPYAMSVTSGALPTGITISGTSLTGTPSAEGNYAATVTVTDADGGAVPVAVNIHIAEPLSILESTADITMADAYIGVNAVCGYVMNDTSGLFFARQSAITIDPDEDYGVGHYTQALAETGASAVTYTGDPNNNRLTLLAGSPAGYVVSLDANGGTCNLFKDGGYLCSLKPTSSAASDWWYGENGFSPEYGGLVWFFGGYLYIGIRTTGGSGGTNWNRICRWTLSDLTGGTVAADAVALNIVPAPGTDRVFFMHVDNEGIVRTLDKAGTLKTFSADLTLTHTETVASLADDIRGFGFDQRGFVMIGKDDSDGGIGKAVLYSYPDFTLKSTVDIPVTSTTITTRCVFDSESLYIQRGTDLSRLPYFPGIC